MADRPGIDPEELKPDKPTRRTSGRPAAPVDDDDGGETKIRVNLYLDPELMLDLDAIWLKWRRDDRGMSKSIIVEAAVELALSSNRDQLQRLALRKAAEKREARR